MNFRPLLAGAALLLSALVAQAQNDPVTTCFDYLSAQDYHRAQRTAETLLSNGGGNRSGQLCLGRALEAQGLFRPALQAFLEVERLSRSKEDLETAYNWLGITYSTLGDIDNALLYTQRELGLARELGDRKRESTTLNNLALLHERKGDTARAIALYEESLALSNSDAERATTWNNLALTYEGQGDVERAIATLKKAIDANRRAGNGHKATRAQINLGSVYTDAGQLELAQSELGEALTAIRRIGDKHWEKSALTALGRLAEKRQQPAEAERHYREALALANAIGDAQAAATLTQRAARLRRESTRVSAGAIELGAKGVKAVIADAYLDEKGETELKTAYSRSINTDLGKGVATTGKYSAEAIERSTRAVVELLADMRAKHSALGDNVLVIASSASTAASNASALATSIRAATGLELRLFTPAQEMATALLGSEIGDDKIHKATLLDIGSGNGRLGYLTPSTNGQAMGTVNVDLGLGSVSLAEQARAAANAAANAGTPYLTHLNRIVETEIGPKVANQIAQYPALRKHEMVVLVGGAAWSLATLIQPANRQRHVVLSADELSTYYVRLVTDPNALLNPNLDSIADAATRDAAAREIAAVKATFTLEELQAGARLLKLVGENLALDKQRLVFARNGGWSVGAALMLAVTAQGATKK